MNSKCYILLTALIITSCSEPAATKYKDTTELEVPPTIKIVETEQSLPEKDNEIAEKAISSKVLLAGTEQAPVIKIKKLFDRSWNLVEQALKLNDIEVKDKNRDLGVFYILYSGEEQTPDKMQTFDKISSFFFGDDTKKSGYKLTVAWHVSDTEVAAEIVAEDDDELLDDAKDKEDFVIPVDNSANLINVLYKTLKHDLEIN